MHKSSILLLELLVLALVLASTLAVLPAQALRKVLLPSADSYVVSEGPTRNWGREWTLDVEADGWESLAFLMFDLSQVPSGATIDSAVLSLHVHYLYKKAPVGVYYCSSNDWKEDEITYNNSPPFSPDPIDTANVTSTDTWYDWNVTETARPTHQAVDKRLSLVVKAHARVSIEFDSRNSPVSAPPYQAQEARPQLIISYQPPPPSNGNSFTIIIIAIAVTGAVTTIALACMFFKRRKTPRLKQGTDEDSSLHEKTQAIQ